MNRNEYNSIPFFEEETIDLIAPQMLKRKDVRHLLQVSDGTLRRLIRDGRLRQIRIGSTDRFAIEDVRRLVLDGTVVR